VANSPVASASEKLTRPALVGGVAASIEQDDVSSSLSGAIRFASSESSRENRIVVKACAGIVIALVESLLPCRAEDSDRSREKPTVRSPHGRQ
jgi:hypothetical protein